MVQLYMYMYLLSMKAATDKIIDEFTFLIASWVIRASQINMADMVMTASFVSALDL